MGKSENSGFFPETIAASDLKVSRSSHLIEYIVGSVTIPRKCT